MTTGGRAMPDTYQGREQAFVKHRLLESYLEKLFLIVGIGARRLGVTDLCYVDCFAGPWADESEDLAGTSIAISLAILERCREKLESLGIGPKFRALYVEENPKAFARLGAFLSKRSAARVKAASLKGDFLALRGDILRWCGPDAFVFFFIDPKGWKEVSVGTLGPLLIRPKSEFLINFQYDFINRTVSMAEWTEDIALLLGEGVYVEALVPHERDKHLVDTYRSNLKRSMPSATAFPARSAYVRVLDLERDRPKYHLIYLTSHPRGIVEFMQISETVDLIQKQVRASRKDQTRAKRSGMNDMFGADTLVDRDEGPAEPAEVDHYWLGYLGGEPRSIGEAEFGDILEQTNWFPCDLQSSLVRLIDSGTVKNLDANRRRPKKPLHWEKAERLVVIKGSG
jgi:three-Cys-motif partner protein